MNTDILNRLAQLRTLAAQMGPDEHRKVARALFEIFLELGITPADAYGIGQHICRLTF
jgi:hypothetical protein